MAREIVLDTETTGLDPASGHRIIEIACVELDDLLPTGRSFHRYVNPGREVDPDAQRVHGISNEFLIGKPKFEAAEVVDEFLAFIDGADLVAHNARFDRGFIDNELQLVNRACPEPERWIDTLALAQKRFPGMHNSLDALCKRFKVSLAERDKHGALIDARLLADVYLELRGGRETALDLTTVQSRQTRDTGARVIYGPRLKPLPARLSAADLDAHRQFVAAEMKDKAIWLELDS